MGIRMTLHVTPNDILISIDSKNAFDAIRRAAILERHNGYMI
jgi:hypothetical protein